jgi:diguanylate cyclase (GGDEF)-like protein/PAS domain S-box-containing protein
MADELTEGIDFRVLFDALGDEITVVGLDGRIVWVNRRACEVLHRTPFELIGRDAMSLIHPDDVPAATQALADSMENPGLHVTMELRADDGLGGWLPLEFVGSTHLGNEHMPPLVLLASRSLRWRWSASEAAALIGRGAKLGDVVQQLARLAGEMLEVESVVLTWGSDVGRFGSELPRTRYYVTNLFDDSDVASIAVAFGQPQRPWASDQRTFREIARMASVLRQRESDVGRLRYLAGHDDLTGFDNRRATTDRLLAGVAIGSASVLFVDLDGFKLVNDSLGHDVGDRVLQATAARLLSSVASRGSVGRYGGDEFVVVMSGPLEFAKRCASDIVRNFHEPLLVDGRVLTLTVSVGISHLDEPTTEHRGAVEALLRDAGTALHQAKVEGRDRWTMFHSDQRRSVVDRLEATQAIRRSFEHDEIRLHFQPQIDLVTNEIVGCEALLRWTDLDRGFASPTEFLRLAGEIGLLSQLSRRTLLGGCEQLAAWRREFPEAANWFVGINLAPAEIDHAGIVDLVDEGIETFGLKPADVQLEIVEHAFASGGQALRNVHRLHDRGVGLAIDDFGVGESSLARLRDLPIDTLKIDRSLITGVLHERVSHAIASSIATLGQRLGVTVVAEGIETAADLAAAREIGCHRGQGYFIGRPVAPELLISGRHGNRVGPNID